MVIEEEDISIIGIVDSNGAVHARKFVGVVDIYDMPMHEDIWPLATKNRWRWNSGSDSWKIGTLDGWDDDDAYYAVDRYLRKHAKGYP